MPRPFRCVLPVIHSIQGYCAKSEQTEKTTVALPEKPKMALMIPALTVLKDEFRFLFRPYK